MGYNKRNTTLILIITIVSVLGLSIAFAAFSSTLTISSKANVTPDASSFKVAFSSSSTSLVTNKITPQVSGSATASAATISGTTISGLSVNLTKPEDWVSYYFYAYNAGSYDAILHLGGITVTNASGATTFKKCTAGSGTTASLVSKACEDIVLSIDISGEQGQYEMGKTISNGKFDIYNTMEYRINKKTSNMIIINIYYKYNSTNLADGPFTVDFGDITLTYSSN